MLACNYLNLHYDSHCIHFCCADVIRLSKSIFCSLLLHLFCTKFISLFVLTRFHWYWARSECLFHLSLLISLLFVLMNFLFGIWMPWMVIYFSSVTAIDYAEYLWNCFHSPWSLVSPGWSDWIRNWIFSLDMANDIREQIDFHLPAGKIKHSVKQSKTNGSPVTNFTTKHQLIDLWRCMNQNYFLKYIKICRLAVSRRWLIEKS